VTTPDATGRIASTAIIGSSFRPLLDGRTLHVERDTCIAPSAWIGHFTTVGQGVSIGESSIVEDYVAIQPEATIGAGVLVTDRSWIGIGVTIGDGSVIRGHVGDHSQVGANCRVAGDLIHRQLDPSIPWDDSTAEEPAPVVKDGAFIGWRAIIVGGVNIGHGAYVCAGALITKDVPDGHIARGRNEIMSARSWDGQLGKSPFFQDSRWGARARLGAKFRRARLPQGRRSAG
jgi:acetyltransferase-like isoleucine patch superfamily enzyme